MRDPIDADPDARVTWCWRRPRPTPPGRGGGRGDGGRGHAGARGRAFGARTEIGSDAYFGGLVVEQSAGLNPAKLTAGLADLAEAAGAALHEETRAIRLRPQADGRSVVETSRGAVIAKEVIVGTNGYTGGLTPSLRRRILAISSFIIVTEPLAPEVAAEISPHRPAVLRHQELPLLLAADARQPDAVRRPREHVADVGAAGGVDPAAGDGRHPPAAVADAGRVRMGRAGGVHVRPDGPRRARRRGHLRHRAAADRASR